MHVLHRIMVLVFILPLPTTAQLVASDPISDFLISTENTPSTLIQSNVRLFPRQPSGFIAAWQDGRGGERGCYAQLLTDDGSFIGHNFPILSNELIRYTGDGSFLSIGSYQTSGSYFFPSYATFEGQFYNSAGHALTKKTLETAYIPDCGTGYLWFDAHCASTNEHYLFLLRDDGLLRFTRYDRQGNVVLQKGDSIFSYRRATSATITSNTRDEYVIARFDIESSTFHPLGYSATFFDDHDSIIAQDVPLGFPVDTSHSYFSPGTFPYLKVQSVSDTSYFFFVVNPDSAMLYTRTFDHSGNPLCDVHSLPIPHATSDYFSLSNFSVSSLHNDTMNVLLTSTTWSDGGPKDFNVLYPFGADGTPTNKVMLDTIHSFRPGEHFIKTSDSTFLFGTQDTTDVYLTATQWLTPIDSIKLNDDSSGSNAIAPCVAPISDDRFFVTWQDEKRIAGQVVDLNGTRIGNPVTLDGQSSEFFSDGSSINLWQHRDAGYLERFGFTLYDVGWNVTRRETIAVGHIYSGVGGTAKILNDSMFVILYSNDSDEVWLKRFDKAGLLVQETLVATHDYSYNLWIAVNDAESFWIHYGTKVRLYSKTLTPLTDARTTSASLYVGDGMFLSTSTDMYGWKLYGTIVSTSGDTINQKFYIATRPDELSYGRLTDRSFLVVFQMGNTIYAKAFSSSGMPEKDSIVIHSPTTGSKKNGTFSVRHGKVFFAWAEVRPTTALAYSIFGSVVSTSVLVGVKEVPVVSVPTTFALHQNYPNPFNPSTVIRYSIPAVERSRSGSGSLNEAAVTLRIFDVLGREVATLVDGVQQPGEYSVRWNAENVPSGIYFYRLQSGKFSETRKLILMR